MQHFLCKEWRYFLLALGFFTRIPVPSFANFEEQDLNHSAKYFPLVGIVVGLAGAVVFVLAAWIFPDNIAVLLSMVATIYITGAFHEDGMADSIDGIGGGWDRERILTIMQDSRLGTFGALALFLMLFAKYQVLNALPADTVAFVLVAAHALSRLCAVYVMATLSYVKASGKAKPLAVAIQMKGLVVATVFGLLPLMLLYWYFLTNIADMPDALILLLSWLISVSFIWIWWRNKIKRWLGGYTGDCLGAMQQMTELAFYLGVLAYFGFSVS
jgi:adenosylcobinamide-GDP ribazoletransferase